MTFLCPQVGSEYILSCLDDDLASFDSLQAVFRAPGAFWVAVDTAGDGGVVGSVSGAEAIHGYIG